jgi:hypothetical protein
VQDLTLEMAVPDASNLLPTSWTPEEELIFEKGECRDCGLKSFDGVRAWAHQHVQETGHAVQLHYGYDVRDAHWLDRLPYDRQAELERLRADPAAAQELARKLLRDHRYD